MDTEKVIIQIVEGMKMSSTMLYAQIAGTFVIAVALLVSVRQLRTMEKQLKAMEKASNGQNVISVVWFLQSKEVRDARSTVRKILKGRDCSVWSPDEEAAASTTCSSFDAVEIVSCEGAIDNELLIRNYESSIRDCFEVCKQYIYKMRLLSDYNTNYWRKFENLYNRLPQLELSKKKEEKIV